ALAAGVAITYVIENSKLGSYFVAIREDEDAAESLGINTAYYKTLAFVISAALMAMGGTLYAQYVLYIHPGTTSTLRVSCTLLAMAVIGGAGTVLGPVVGAFLLVPLGEYTRGLLGGRGRGIHLMIYAAALIVVATIAPGGIVGLIAKTRLYSKIQRTIRERRAEI
ncbi:MAG: branched-chain amino acid ABC transporter permease, partial [Candidatus Hadarchaeota archaeon]|nr:branched-chain amino acid ABC transporter permease [Candidatus Hadarchaeota archaeon]